MEKELLVDHPVELPARRPRPRSRISKFLVGAGVAAVVLLATVNSKLPFAPHLCRGRHGKDSPFGRFPRPDDPFHFIPCTDRTTPPALEDPDPRRSWVRLFDPDPTNWNWGNASAADHEGATTIPIPPFSGRGIYLCGYLDVPLDYSNKSDERIARLAVTKFQVSGLVLTGATAGGKKSERTLVIEPGGPGGSGTSMAWRLSEEITNRLSDGQYDVLGWDPAASTPLYRPSPLEFVDAMSDSVFSACYKQHGDIPRFMTTAIVARDLEEIRKALAEDELTGYLVSYGTGIGQTYASMFPNSVGRMILDGTEYVRDHRLVGGFGWTALDNGTNAWHDGFLGECLNAGPKHCALAKQVSAESVTLKSLEKRMHSLISSLIERPLPGYTDFSGPSLITYSSLVGALYGSMYNAKSWPALAQMLFELEAGNATLAAAMLERVAWGYDPTLPSEELGTLVICADSYDAKEPEGGMDWWEGLWQNMTERSWIAGNSRFSNYWPEPAEVYRGDLNHTLKHPVLLIAETYDPATPLRNGRRLLNEMGKNARLIAHHGYGHSSRDTSNCTDSIAKKFILEGVVPDEQETACYANEKPYLYGVKKGM
ncbi:hypothetical protein ACCO45_006737 [Purpureocillium lilacinum]|uniref:Uncharacterized protein n=1 Tax=Purpureocillium lilacinum TaxID=33203 RepID=A0ACC4DQC1_PURLI